jgi:hypothetical protein
MVGKLAQVQLFKKYAVVKTVLTHTEFRESPVHWSLTALETLVNGTACSRVGTFGSSSRSFSNAGAWSATNALRKPSGAGVVP